MADEETNVEEPQQEKPETVEEQSVETETEATPEPAPETREEAVEEARSEEPVVEEKAEEKQPARPAPPLSEDTLFVWGTGRRKASVARVRIRPGDGKFLVNDREIADYFFSLKHQQKAVSPLETVNMNGSFDVWVNVRGGGKTGQADAVSLGLARAIAKHVPDVEHSLRDKGLLTRDSRVAERKKPGQPGARKRFQFSKR